LLIRRLRTPHRCSILPQEPLRQHPQNLPHQPQNQQQQYCLLLPPHRQLNLQAANPLQQQTHCNTHKRSNYWLSGCLTCDHGACSKNWRMACVANLTRRLFTASFLVSVVVRPGTIIFPSLPPPLQPRTLALLLGTGCSRRSLKTNRPPSVHPLRNPRTTQR
jgi:hypothetical protein